VNRYKTLAAAAGVVLVAAGAIVAIAAHRHHTAPPATLDRCATIATRYGLTPCPPVPLPVESVPVVNADPKLDDAQAQRIGQAYLRSRAYYYLGISANSTKLFAAGVLDLPDQSPMMFDAETQHIQQAAAAHGQLVLRQRSRLTAVRIVPLPDELRTSLGTATEPLADAVAITVVGPERQVVAVPGQPDLIVTEQPAGDPVQLLVGGVLREAPGLDETWAELGQWDCLDPDTLGACLLPKS
jgi:hypothetical protein